MNVKDYCIEISKLLKSAGENSWYEGFEYFIKEFETSEEKIVLKKIRIIYGGAGSFNDLVLYKNGQVCVDENEKLNKLRKELFQKLIDKIG